MQDQQIINDMIDINKLNNEDYSDIHSVLDDENMIRSLISLGSSVNTINLYGRTVLHDYIIRQSINPEIIKLILDNNFDVNLVDNHGDSVLHLYMNSCNIQYDIVKLLLQYNINTNIVNMDGITALWYYCNRSNLDIEIIKLFVQVGTDINYITWDGSYILHLLCSNICPQIDIIKYLIEFNAEVNILHNYDRTLLHNISHREYAPNILLNLLLDANADPSIFDNNGYGPLYYCCMHDNIDGIKMILNTGCKDLYSGGGSICSFSYDIVKLLLDRNIDINPRRNLELLYKHKKYDIIQLLFDHNIKPDGISMHDNFYLIVCKCNDINMIRKSMNSTYAFDIKLSSHMYTLMYILDNNLVNLDMLNIMLANTELTDLIDVYEITKSDILNEIINNRISRIKRAQ